MLGFQDLLSSIMLRQTVPRNDEDGDGDGDGDGMAYLMGICWDGKWVGQKHIWVVLQDSGQ